MTDYEEEQYLNEEDDPYEGEGCTCAEVPCCDFDCDCTECHG